MRRYLEVCGDCCVTWYSSFEVFPTLLSSNWSAAWLGMDGAIVSSEGCRDDMK